MCMCVAMVWILDPLVTFGGLLHFSCSVVVFLFVSSPFSIFLGRPERVAGHVPQV